MQLFIHSSTVSLAEQAADKAQLSAPLSLTEAPIETTAPTQFSRTIAATHVQQHETPATLQPCIDTVLIQGLQCSTTAQYIPPAAPSLPPPTPLPSHPPTLILISSAFSRASCSMNLFM